MDINQTILLHRECERALSNYRRHMDMAQQEERDALRFNDRRSKAYHEEMARLHRGGAADYLKTYQDTLQKLLGEDYVHINALATI